MDGFEVERWASAPGVGFRRGGIDQAPRRVVMARVCSALRARLLIGSIENVVERRFRRTLQSACFFKSAMTTLFHWATLPRDDPIRLPSVAGPTPADARREAERPQHRPSITSGARLEDQIPASIERQGGLPLDQSADFLPYQFGPPARSETCPFVPRQQGFDVVSGRQ